jgi:phosphatidate cytidylyltransferase
VVLAILADTFAVLDHYDRLFFATAPLTMACIAMVTIPFDQPKGYVQRLGLGSLGFLLCGFSLAYISCIANDPSYRAILLLVLLGVEMNDVFAYCTGKSIGGAKLLPNTSPGKTIAGSVGAIVLTTPLVAFMAHAVFRGSAIDSVHALFVLGVLVSVMGQMGDLVLSSIKRDVGIKDFDVVIPGHGGLLDRFDSLILVVPAVYHYLSLYLGPLGGSQPARIITGR